MTDVQIAIALMGFGVVVLCLGFGNNGITPAKLEVFICEPLKAAAGSLRGPLGFSH